MGNLLEMVGAFVDEETRLELAERMGTYGDDLAEWVRDPTSNGYFTKYKISERAAAAPSQNMAHLFGGAAPMRVADSLDDLSLELKYITEYRDFLENYQSFYWKFENRAQIAASGDSFVDQLIKISASTDWVVKERECRKNYWSNEEAQRLSGTVKTYTLVNRKTGSFADFSTEMMTAQIVNLMHFEVVDLKQRGAAFNTLREFTEVMKLLLLNHPSKPLGVSALVLCFDEENGQKIEPWRFEKVDDPHLKTQTRLGDFWRGAGGIMATELGLDRDPQRIYFWNREKALELRRIAKDQGEPNPFRAVKRSIYGRDVDEILKR